MSPTEQSRLNPAQSEQVIRHETIPVELKRYPQWVCWRYVDRGPDRKPDKRPINPHNLHNAGVSWPNTWSNFEHTYMVYLMYRTQMAPVGIAGIGFVLTADDPFVGLDLDACLDQGQLLSWAQPLIEQVPSYTEVSPSGTGLRVLVTSPDFQQNGRRDDLEIYSHDRFLTLTGNHLAGTPDDIRSCTAVQLTALIPEGVHGPTVQPTLPAEAPSHNVGDAELWGRIFAYDRFGDQHRRRFLGDTSLDGGDHSLTVIRLLNCLARWTRGDATKMRTMMNMSPLANEKWWSKRGHTDWLGHAIEDAVTFTRRHRLA